AIYYGVDSNRTHQEYDQYKLTLVPRILPEGAATSPELDKLEAIRSSANASKYGVNPSMPLLTVATAMRDNLKTLIDPATGALDAGQAMDKAKAAMAADSAKLKPVGVTLPASESLIPAVNSLTNAIIAKDAQIK